MDNGKPQSLSEMHARAAVAGRVCDGVDHPFDPQGIIEVGVRGVFPSDSLQEGRAFDDLQVIEAELVAGRGAEFAIGGMGCPGDDGLEDLFVLGAVVIL